MGCHFFLAFSGSPGGPGEGSPRDETSEAPLENKDPIGIVRCLKRAPLTLKEISQHFLKPIRQASKDIGLGVTQLKNACRRLGMSMGFQ
jgi:hypothetical protein